MSHSILYFSVFLSGMSALIYEVIWHRYLATLLGAQHKATAIVLGIFLGGMSLGYHFFGNLSKRIRLHPLKCLGLVEIGLGVWAFLFPYIFKFCFEHIGVVYGMFGVHTLWVDLLFSILMIGLPTLLMGGTLPLIAQGATSNYDKAAKFHARVYGVNTLGACIGCLLATYFLIPQLNFSMALIFAGACNVVVGIVFYEVLSRVFFYSMAGEKIAPEGSKESRSNSIGISSQELIIFSIAGISGFTLLTLQTALIRLMGLSAGSSNFNFGLVVGIFIFCLGLGSLFTSALAKPRTKHLVQSLFLASLFLLLTSLALTDLPYKHHLMRLVFRTAHENFYVYQFLIAFALFGFLVFPLGFAGATLPLCFQLLKKGSQNLGRRVGQLYAINTLGCLLGGGFGGYFLYQLFDLEGVFRICIYLSVLSALLSLSLVSVSKYSLIKKGVFVLSLVAIIVSTHKNIQFDRALFAQAFRFQFPLAESYLGSQAFAKRIFGANHYVYYKDGPDSSVGIASHFKDGTETSRTLFMNGKSDGNTQGDLVTMQLTGMLPALFSKRIESSCVIGYGTGISIGALTQFKEMRTIDVAEISETLLAERKYFDIYNGGVSENGAVKVHAMDAFRFLRGTDRQYDLIVSEPSTPWLSGVENLYSKEFYGLVSRRLSPDGIFAQWVQAYSFNEDLFRMVLKTVANTFQSVRVFQMRPYDLLILASAKPLDLTSVKLAEERLEAQPKVKAALRDLGFYGVESLLALEVVSPSLANAIARRSKVHSVFAPRLSSGATRAFFAGENLYLNQLIRTDFHFFRNANESLFSLYRNSVKEPNQLLSKLYQSYCIYAGTDFPERCRQLGIYYLWNAEADATPLSYKFKLSDTDIEDLQWLQNSRARFDSGGGEKLSRLTRMFHENFSSYAPLAQEKLFSKIDLCLRRTDFNSAQYGECLLEKIKIVEMTGSPEGEALERFSGWVAKLPLNFPGYDKYAYLKNRFESLPVDNHGGIY